MASLDRKNSTKAQLPARIYSRFEVRRISSGAGAKQIQKCEAFDLGNDDETVLYYAELPGALTSEQQGGITDLRISGIEIFEDGQRWYIRERIISAATLERLTACGLVQTSTSSSPPARKRNLYPMLTITAGVVLLGLVLLWFKRPDSRKPAEVPKPELAVQLSAKTTAPPIVVSPVLPPIVGKKDESKKSSHNLAKTNKAPAQPAPPTIKPVPVSAITTFAAEPETVLFGQFTKLKWRTVNTSTASIDPGYPNVTTEGGEIQVSPVDTTTYTLTAMGLGGPISKTALVIVVPNIALFEVHPFVARGCEVSMLTWRVSGSSSVSIDQGLGKVAAGYSMVVRPSVATTYTITAERNSYSSSKTVTVPGYTSACQTTTK